MTLHLRDVVYRGASQNAARLLSVWTAAANSSDTPVLTDGDDTPGPVAERLSTVLTGPFAVCLLDAQWHPWEVQVKTSAPCTTRGNAAAIESSLHTPNIEIMRLKTGAVKIPLGFGVTRSTAWQVWFDNDAVTFKIHPSSNVSVNQTSPGRGMFGEMSGLSLSDAFLNSVFSNEFKSHLFGLGTTPTLTHIANLRIETDSQRITVLANVQEVPQTASVRMAVDWTGETLGLSNVDVRDVQCGTLSSGDCAQLRAKANLAAVFLLFKFREARFAPEPVEQSLEPFSIGEKRISGTARIRQVQAMSGTTVVLGDVRLKAAP
jgi:hypothetical protein